jgi:hypothetical protein
MAGILLALVWTEGILLGYWALVLGDQSAILFYTLFNTGEKTKRFLSELEQSLGCVSEGDFEGLKLKFNVENVLKVKKIKFTCIIININIINYNYIATKISIFRCLYLGEFINLCIKKIMLIFLFTFYNNN